MITKAEWMIWTNAVMIFAVCSGYYLGRKNKRNSLIGCVATCSLFAAYWIGKA